MNPLNIHTEEDEIENINYPGDEIDAYEDSEPLSDKTAFIFLAIYFACAIIFTATIFYIIK